MYITQNVEKKSGGGAGVPTPNKPNVTLVRSKDILSRPVRDSKGVKMLGDYVMKPGAKMFSVYMIPSKQEQSYSSDGDEDMLGILQKYVGIFPGDTLEINEFVQNILGEDIEIIAGNCVDGHKRGFGTECSPMKLKPEYKSDNSGRMHTLTFEQYTKTQFVPGFYYGAEVFSEPSATDVTVDVTEAGGTQYKVEALDITADITWTTMELEHGDHLTLVGSGGADPATLSNDAGTAAVAKLKDGTAWTALLDATITFEVFDDGTDKYLIERSRS